MKQEDLCEGKVISIDQKPIGTKYKCPTCGRRMKIASRAKDDYIEYFIPKHKPKGWYKKK